MEQIHEPNSHIPGQNWDYPPAAPSAPVAPVFPFFPTGKKELRFGLAILIFGMLLCNCVLYGGFSLGFAVFGGICTLCAALYLCSAGHKLRPYPAAILALCLVITAGFARSDDGFVKFVMICFLAVGVNLGLCLLAGQNHWSPAGVASLLDAPRTAFGMGVGGMSQSARGLRFAGRQSGSAGKRSGAVILGLVIALALLCVLIPLLTQADAAFDGLIRLLPQLDLSQVITTLIFGGALAYYLYTRAVALSHRPKAAPASAVGRGCLSALTVNIVLGAVGIVYLAYLLSQLGYLSGGFAGIVPEGFTKAEYARRGFFEMALLCAINLGIIALAMGLVKKDGGKLLSIRLLCLFIGLVTLFLVATASAKMLLYIGGFGLTRLRVLTEVITVFLGLAACFVMVWLFVPKLPYMKAIFLAGLAIGGAVLWADVDTVVARYNVTAYQNHTLETIDVDYLGELGNGAVPYLDQLTRDSNPDVAVVAQALLQARRAPDGDIRGWNYVNHIAMKYEKPIDDSSSTPERNVGIRSLDDFYNTSLTEGLDIRWLGEAYSAADAQNDGCFVIGAMVHNDELYTAFMEDCAAKETAFIRVAQNTVEGGLILYDILYYQPTERLYLVTDQTRDPFSGQSDREIQMREFENIAEYEYAGRLYWVVYNGELTDEALQSDRAFVLAILN